MAARMASGSVPTGEVEMSDYNPSDISAAYRYKAFTLTVAVDNLFDERYEQYVGFVDPGRRVRAMAKLERASDGHVYPEQLALAYFAGKQG